MARPTPARRTPCAAGFTLFEVLAAVLILGLCLIPAADALRGAIGAPAVAAGAAHNLDCVGSLMETVLAEPYARLLQVAKGTAAYPIPVDAGCPDRKVVVALYGNNTTGQIGAGATDEDLLYVSVSLSTPVDGASYPFTSLVSR
jgi:prepilin-type N-terminal cleavage/methylation domain-containing protein